MSNKTDLVNMNREKKCELKPILFQKRFACLHANFLGKSRQKITRNSFTFLINLLLFKTLRVYFSHGALV